MVSSQSSSQTSGQQRTVVVPISSFLNTTQLAKQTSLGSTSSSSGVLTSPTIDIENDIISTPPASSSSVADKSELGGHQRPLEGRGFPKPPYSYCCLIALAIKNSKAGTLHVAEIYKFLRSLFPYFRTAPKGWKNAVRHCLSLNKCFEKHEVPHRGGRRYHVWLLNEKHSSRVETDLQRWHDKHMEEIVNAMEYPEFVSLLQKGALKVEYSSSEDEAEEEEDTMTTISISDSRLRGVSDSHSTIPVVVLRQNDSSLNTKQDGCLPKTSVVNSETHVSRNQSSITSVITNSLDKSNYVANLDDPEIICLE